ncbi:MAG TPA: hypothetical protein VFH95_10165 [Candidatus Kapabacteria bacterium]|nr:hypothetical protein [Candidatus Kapabacteria bacterium]
MIAFILLRGRQFSLPDSVSAAIIGLFFGLICGLFYYQHYLKPWFWVFSLGGGLILTIISNAAFARLRAEDNALGLGTTIASFAIPFVLTLALNHGLHLIKRKKRTKRKVLREHAQFFDMVEDGEPLPSKLSAKDIGT